MGPFYYYADNDNIIRYHNNWYGDGSNFVDSYNSWFIRSGAYDYGIHSGQFYFFVHTGSGNIGASFRIVLM